jgi:hypothetical protein
MRGGDDGFGRRATSEERSFDALLVKKRREALRFYRDRRRRISEAIV